MIAVVLWGLLAFAWWGVGQTTPDQLTGQVVITVALVLLSWLVLWRPHLVVTTDHIEVRNPLRRHVIAWPAIRLIDTSWQVMLTTDTTRIGVWSAVSGGRHTSFWASRDQAEHLPASTYQGGVVKPGDLLGTESGEIAAIIRHYWEHLRHTSPHTDPHTAPNSATHTTTTTSSHATDWVGVVGCVVAVVAGVAGLVLISV